MRIMTLGQDFSCPFSFVGATSWSCREIAPIREDRDLEIAQTEE